MTLFGALGIGGSGLAASQAAIEVTGNNLANISTPGYSREVLQQSPAADQQVGNAMVGQGVVINQISQQVDQALNARVNSSVSDQSASGVSVQMLTQIQSLENELSGSGLSSQLTTFFNDWSNLANDPGDASTASTVVQEGQSMSSFVQNLRSGLTGMQTQVAASIGSAVTAANNILTQIANLNGQIADDGANQTGSTTASNSLLDQRSQLLSQLSQYMDVSVTTQASGADNVYVGSTALVLGDQNRGVETQQQTVNGQVQTTVNVTADGTQIQPSSGQIGALLNSNTNDIGNAITTLDSFANNLIYQVNRVYSQGQGNVGVASVTGSNAVADANAALDSSAAGLANAPTSGSFEIDVTSASTGKTTTAQIPITLGGTNPSTQTTLTSLVASLNAVAGVKASISNAGQLQISGATSDQTITFGKDSSGALASLGVNTFFTGQDASDIGMNQAVVQNPNQLAIGQNQVQGDNSNALAIAALGTQALPALKGQSLNGVWNQHVEDYAVRLGNATEQNQADTTVVTNLQSQQQSVSGVNTDQEAINLMAYQQAYQGSAQFLTTVDNMFNTLFQII